MHRLFLVPVHKRHRNQIQKSIQEPLKTELRIAIFPRLVLDYLFTDLSISIPFSQQGDITVHFAINLNIFYHLISVSLQATVEIMQLDPGDPPSHSIKKFGRNCF